MQTLAYILIFSAFSGLNFHAVHLVTPSYIPVSDEITVENIISLTNKDRRSQGLTPLKENTYLDGMADFKASNMASTESFSHINSLGLHTYDIVNKEQYPFTVYGENLAILFTSASHLEERWMDSPTHRDNIMDERYTDIGVSIVEGTYKGMTTTYIAVEFGTTK